MSPSNDLTALARNGADALVASLDKERAAIEAFANDLCAAAQADTEDKLRTAKAAADAALAKERERAAGDLVAAEAMQRATTEQLDGARRELHEAQNARAGLLAQLEDTRDALAQSERLAQERAAVLERVTASLRAIRAAASSRDIFDVLLDALSAHFERAAILVAGAGGLKCWLHRGFDDDAAVDGLILGFDTRSPALLALQTREAIEIERTDAAQITGLCGEPISKALALPMVAADRTIAVAYTESRTMPAPEDFEIGRRLAEILVEFASRRVNAKRPPIDAVQPLASDSAYSIQRRARRLRMRDAVNILLDGSASFLIDLSTRGLQVLSPAGLRPKQEVRIMLVVGDRTIECAGRVVWALFEQAKGASGALYRAGVEFIEVDTPAVEAFLAGMGMARRELVAR